MGARLVDEALARSRAHGAAVEGDAAPGGEDGLGIAAGNGPPTAPSEATIATQELSINADDPYVGTFKVGFDGAETPDIDVAVATVDDIVALLEALPGIGAGNIVDTNGNGPYTLDDAGSLYLEFVGDLAGQAVPLLEVVDLDMTGNGTPIAPEDFAFAVGNEGAPAGAGTPADPTDGQLYLDLDAPALYEYHGGDGFWLDVAQYAVDQHEEADNPHSAYVVHATIDATDAALAAHAGDGEAHAAGGEIAEHEAAGNPHPAYATDAEAAAAATDVMNTHMNTDGLHSGLTYSGIADPTAGAGVAASQGNLYQRLNGSAGELWLKTGAGDPDWTKIDPSGDLYVRGLFVGSADPSAGGGVDQPIGSLYRRTGVTTNVWWQKTGAGATEWVVVFDANKIWFGAAGVTIGAASTPVGFYGATPVAQPTPVADAITAVDVILRFNELMARLRTTGLIDT